MTDAAGTKSPDTAPSPARPRFRWSWWRWLVASLGALLSAGVLVIGLIVGTQTGLRIAVAVVEDLAPDMLQVERVDGRLAGHLRLEGLQLRLDALEVRLSALDLDWHPLGAIAGRLRVDALVMGDLDIVLGPSRGSATEGAASEPFQLPELWLPIAVEILSARLQQLVVAQATDAGEMPQLRLAQISLGAGWQGHRLDLRELAAHLPDPGLWARAEGQVELLGDYPLRLELGWGLEEGVGIPLEGSAQANGDLAGELAVTHDLSGAAEARLVATLTKALDAPSWDAELVIARVDLPALQADLPALDFSGRLVSSGSLDAASLDATLAAAAPERSELGQWQAVAALSWRERTLLVESLELTESQSSARFRADGQLDLGAEPAGLRLTGAWQQLRWPLTGEATVQSPGGQIDAAGTIEALDYQVSADVVGTALPEAGVDLAGEADLTATRIGTLQVKTLDGQITGRGELDWDQGFRWDVALAAAGLDPGVHWPEWSGRLGGEILSQGALVDGSPDLSVRLAAIDGTLRGYPVAASGQLAAQGDALQIDDLAVSSGPSRLRVNGEIAERMAIELDLASPDLGSLLPDARGRVDVSGRISGTPARPELSLKVAADQVELGEQSLSELSGDLQLGLDQAAPFAADLRGRDLRLGDLAWSDLRLQGDGTTGDHRVSLELDGPTLALAVAATGGLSDGPAYVGQLMRMDLSTEAHGDWRLARPSPLQLGPPATALGPLCVDDGAGSGGCLELAQSSEQAWRIQLDVDRVDLAQLSTLLPDRLAALGIADARADLTMTDARLRGTARLGLPEGRLVWQAGATEDEVVDFSGARLDLNAEDTGLAARLVVPLTGLGAVEADVRLADWRLDAPARPEQPLRGRLRVDLNDLSRFARLVPDLTEVTGQLSADLALSGSLGRPGISGDARLTQAGFDVALIGLRVRDAELSALAAAGNRIEYQGEALIGGGRLDVRGTTRETGDGWASSVAAKGADLRVADTKEYQVLIAPDLEAELGPNGVRIEGEVRMPEAAFRPRSLPAGTVTPSPDVVTKETPKEAPVPLELDVRLVLGQEVTLDAFGVRGALRGNLRVLQSPEQREPRGDGQLQIVDGTYRLATGLGLLAAVGKPLEIEQGRLIFARTPLANPGLLLQAQRESGDLTAGIQVSGTLRTPKLSFFSDTDPGMTQAEISNYLITGNPPKRGAEEENRSLAVGTYVAPKLYTEYVTSIGDEADKVRLRYELMDNVEVQTETGDSQGVDIFFKFEN